MEQVAGGSVLGHGCEGKAENEWEGVMLLEDVATLSPKRSTVFQRRMDISSQDKERPNICFAEIRQLIRKRRVRVLTILGTVKPGYKHGLRTDDYMLIDQDMLMSRCT